LAFSRKRALAFFERQDPRVLVRRIDTVDYLLGEFTPFYTLDELANHLDQFVTFLGKHQDDLIGTGLPPEPFRRCRWLDAHLGRLYDTRVIDPRQPANDTRPNTQVSEPVRRWLRSLPRTKLDCGYDGVPFMPRIKGADGCRLETLRPTCFNVKAKIAALVAKAARRRHVDHLWADCLEVLTKAFLAEDVQFLLKMDLQYLQGELLDDWHEMTGIHYSPGGLTNLLLVAGHVEKELTLRTLSEAKTALCDLPKMVAERDESRSVSHPYLLLIGRPKLSQIDRALDDMAQNCDREREFWEGFRQRVWNACKREFQATVEVLVPAKHRARLAPLLNENARRLQTQIEKDEPLLQLDAKEQNENSFRRDGECWAIQFEGESFPLTDSVGLFYIQYLLREKQRNPGQLVHATTLKLASMKFNRPSGTAEQSSAVAEICNDHMSARPASDSGNVLDPTAWEGVQQQFHELNRELADAERENDPDEIARIKEEKQQLARSVSEAIGPDGQVRKLGNQEIKDSKAVGNAIRRALESIETRSPALFRHLANTIKSGVFCSYQPDRAVDWVT
jgi:hypothetical protein